MGEDAHMEMGMTCSTKEPSEMDTMWDPWIRKRNLGRPKKKWPDVFTKVIGGQWTHEA